MLIHGRHDLSCPLVTAWELARAWPGCELVIVEDAGHTGSERMAEEIHAGIRRLSERSLPL